MLSMSNMDSNSQPQKENHHDRSEMFRENTKRDQIRNDTVRTKVGVTSVTLHAETVRQMVWQHCMATARQYTTKKNLTLRFVGNRPSVQEIEARNYRNRKCPII